MLCEGLYLYKLIVHAFHEQIKIVSSLEREKGVSFVCNYYCFHLSLSLSLDSGSLVLGRLASTHSRHGAVRHRSQSKAFQ